MVLKRKEIICLFSLKALLKQNFFFLTYLSLFVIAWRCHIRISILNNNSMFSNKRNIRMHSLKVNSLTHTLSFQRTKAIILLKIITITIKNNTMIKHNNSTILWAILIRNSNSNISSSSSIRSSNSKKTTIMCSQELDWRE